MRAPTRWQRRHRRDTAVRHVLRAIEARAGGFPCFVYGAQLLLDALSEVDEGAAAVRFLTNATPRGWLGMINTGAGMTRTGERPSLGDRRGLRVGGLCMVSTHR